LRDREKEYERRQVQPLVVVAQQAFQLKRPRTLQEHWAWPAEVPTAVLFDPAATVSATYGVAFQNRFRDGPWSSRPAIFAIDRDGVIRHVGSRPDQDLREKEIFKILDGLGK
jgi:peroxiredoxin